MAKSETSDEYVTTLYGVYYEFEFILRILFHTSLLIYLKLHYFCVDSTTEDIVLVISFNIFYAYSILKPTEPIYNSAGPLIHETINFSNVPSTV